MVGMGVMVVMVGMGVMVVLLVGMVVMVGMGVMVVLLVVMVVFLVVLLVVVVVFVFLVFPATSGEDCYSEPIVCRLRHHLKQMWQRPTDYLLEALIHSKSLNIA